MEPNTKEPEESHAHITNTPHHTTHPSTPLAHTPRTVSSPENQYLVVAHRRHRRAVHIRRYLPLQFDSRPLPAPVHVIQQNVLMSRTLPKIHVLEVSRFTRGDTSAPHRYAAAHAACRVRIHAEVGKGRQRQPRPAAGQRQQLHDLVARLMRQASSSD